jgi:tetratricopeptide (TPR) repeat protein
LPADSLIGRTIGQYEIVARVGGGSMGVVYKARDGKLGRVVALKFLPQQWSHDDSAKQRFVREAQAASATDHPNICTIHDIQTADDGQLFIVMAFYDGPTLKQRLESGPMSIDEALEIATQIADGLAKAHGQGIVHRDIKPGNVILHEDGARILDFGLATFVDALKLTSDNASFGTPAYMSPEQVRGQAADARSDVWAVGVVLYEMLAGHVPFQGAYAEAIAHAVRHEAPTPLRSLRPEISEDVEQLVFRALHKETSVRFSSGRALARALRQMRGLSVPVDLRTESLSSIPVSPPTRSMRRAGRRRLLTAVATVLVAAVAAAVWLLWPVERSRVLVAPIANQTGRAELDPYRLALTHAAIARLSESRNVHPVSYRRVLQGLQRFSRDPAADVSSRDAVQSLALDSAVDIVIIPTLLYEHATGSWRARVEFRDVRTATNVNVAETSPVVSSLAKDTAYGLTEDIAVLVDEHFTSKRSAVLDTLASITRGREPRLRATGMRTVDATGAYERGVRAYEALEYADALQAFQAAAAGDTRHPLPAAWVSRVARHLTRWDLAREMGDKALALVTTDTAPTDALFARAVVAEAHRQNDEAEARYRDLASAAPDEPMWLVELAAFQDRVGKTTDAVGTYHVLTSLDSRMIRPHLELCRLYNSTRMNESTLARQHGNRARESYAAIGDGVGEGLALLCLADILRVGQPADRVEARRLAERALAMFERLAAHYNLARAFHYVALTSAREDPVTAVAAWEKALPLAEQVSNTVLEATVLVNLGTANADLGNRTRSVEYYRRSSRTNEARGDEQGAAYSLANAGALLIGYGTQPDDGLRDVQNALAVVRRIEDRNFEAFCLRMIARYHRQVGRRADAERELRQAQAIARERGLDDALGAIAAEFGRLYLDASEYGPATAALQEAVGKETGAARLEAQIRLARVQLMLGDLSSAAALLGEAEKVMTAPRNARLIPLLYVTRGLLALEANEPNLAHREFARAATVSASALLDEANVEARAYLGLLDARAGRRAAGKAAVQASIEEARRMRRVALEARCRLLLGQILMLEARPREVLTAVSPVPLDALGTELQSALHLLRAHAFGAAGDGQAAQRERRLGGQKLQQLRDSLPQPDQYARRATIAALLAEAVR